MDLEMIECNVKGLIDYANAVKKDYEQILQSIVNISSVLPNEESSLKSAVEDLRKKYENIINELNGSCLDETNKILKYVDQSNNNLLELTQNLKVTVKVYDDINTMID